MATKSERIYVDGLNKSNRARRLLWLIVYYLFFRVSPPMLLGRWRLFLLRLFGARIGHGCKVAPSAFIWAPWNLRMGEYSCIAGGTDIYTVDTITIGSNVTVSQRAFLCTGSHDIRTLRKPLIHRPIEIGDHAWVCAETFVGPGVTIGEGAVVAARACVFRDVQPWDVVAGNPAAMVKQRVIDDGR